MSTNVFLVDDHELMREGLKTVLRSRKGITVVGEAQNFNELVSKLKSEDVDILILDINLPDKSGMEVLRYLRAHHADIRVLVLSMHPEERFATRVLRGGASGYVNKQTAARELILAIERIMNGGKYLSPAMTEHLVSEEGGRSGDHLHEQLSDREFEIMRMIALGYPAARIAQDLSLSVNTINTYRSRILEKMNLKTNADIVRYALEHSLID